MTSLSDTIRHFAAFRALTSPDKRSSHHLAEIPAFGSDPGNLAGWFFVPDTIRCDPPLVVGLHACTQSAASYDGGSHWAQLAADLGFIVLYQQRRQNNSNLCFNWFEPSDIRRDSGEALSIRHMIETICINHNVDSRQVFITGLSAGGAMADVMLSSYPEIFSAGAIIGGLPYGVVASSVPHALERMRGVGLPSGATLSGMVHRASAHAGPWPAVSLWQGSKDRTVAEANAYALVDQWLGVHGLSPSSSKSSLDSSHHTTRWSDSTGFVPVEFHSIDGTGHDTPIDERGGFGSAGPFMLDVGVSSSAEITRSWNLTPSIAVDRSADAVQTFPLKPQGVPATGIQDIIEKAFRSAGLCADPK